MVQNGQSNSRGLLSADGNGITGCTQVKNKRTGAYKINVEGSVLGPFFVYCDMETEYGGWTVSNSFVILANFS